MSNKEFAILHLKGLIAGLEDNSKIPVQISELRLLLKFVQGISDGSEK